MSPNFTSGGPVAAVRPDPPPTCVERLRRAGQYPGLTFYLSGRAAVGQPGLPAGIYHGTPVFTRATAAYTLGADGVWAQVAAGNPRAYCPPGGRAGILIEPARTNLSAARLDDANTDNLPDTWNNAGGTPGTDFAAVALDIAPGKALRSLTINGSSGVTKYGGAVFTQGLRYAAAVYVRSDGAITLSANNTLQLLHYGGYGSVSITSGTIGTAWARLTKAITPGASQTVLDADIRCPQGASASFGTGTYWEQALQQIELGDWASTPIIAATMGTARGAETLAFATAKHVYPGAGTLALCFRPLWGATEPQADLVLFAAAADFALVYEAAAKKFKFAAGGASVYLHPSAATFAAGEEQRLSVSWSPGRKLRGQLGNGAIQESAGTYTPGALEADFYLGSNVSGTAQAGGAFREVTLSRFALL